MPTEVPPTLAAAIAEIGEPSYPYGERLRKLTARARERGAGPDELLSWQLAGIAGDPGAYRMFDSKLTNLFTNRSNLNFPAGEVQEAIIGSGFHAAVYAATWHQRTGQKPLVIEGSATVGGAFAVSSSPSFYLISESTGGMPGAPWGDAANDLNWLPGGPVQASQISGREVPDNTVMRFVIRAALALHARVITRTVVSSVFPAAGGTRRLYVRLLNGREIAARRVIDARGIGADKEGGVNGTTILSWSQAMARMDTDFPFDGMRRVAVIGGGKSALCACESLLGIGPDSTLRSPAGGGIPDRVDLYSASLPRTREGWLEQVQTRYARLASHLPVGTSEPDDDGETTVLPGYGLFHDLYVIAENGIAAPVTGGVLVNGRFYDAAVICTGHETPRDLLPEAVWGKWLSGGRYAATKAAAREYYRVGPVAEIPWGPADVTAGITGNVENRVAMHRLGPLTAAVAATLPPI